MDKKKLVICAIFENEARYLPEWLVYHQVVGVGHFVLYDNGSTDDPARAIRNSPLAEHVTLIHWPQRPGQLAAYRHFIDIFAPGFEWAAFLEVDEFLLPLNGRNVVDTLDRQSNASAVLVHWRVFGPGPWEEPPPGLVIETYDQRAADDFPANRRIRTIARCNDLLDVTTNPHEFKISGPVFNTAGQPAPNTAIQEQPCYQNLAINRYHARSRQDWLRKVQRGGATFDDGTGNYEAGSFDRLADACRVKDATIKAFAPAVRRLLGLDAAASPAPTGAGPAVPASVAPAPGAPAPGAPPAAMPASVVPAAPPTSVVPAVAAQATTSQAARSEQFPRPAAAVFVPVEAAPGWLARGRDAQERAGGLALVFRDRSRPGDHWLAAIRGAAAATIDPDFLLDELDRIRDFSTDAEAREACDAALARGPG